MTEKPEQPMTILNRLRSAESGIRELEYMALANCLAFYLSDDADSWGVEKEVVYDAVSLAIDMNGAGIPCPKVFSHGGDAIAFTWEGIGAVTVGDPQLGWSYFGDCIKKNRYSSFPSSAACCQFLAALFTALEAKDATP